MYLAAYQSHVPTGCQVWSPADLGRTEPYEGGHLLVGVVALSANLW